jgi:SAM-dependent methyltransferase
MVPPESQVGLLAELAGDGRVLELGVGTGRVALPLAARGVAVEGIDASPAMVAQLRAKPGGEVIPVAIGDMASLETHGPFRLVYVVFNTIFGLLTQDAQIAAYGGRAERLPFAITQGGQWPGRPLGRCSPLRWPPDDRHGATTG